MRSPDLFFRLTIATISLLVVSGCSKKEVMAREVKASSTEEFNACRETLLADFTPARLRDFDTAIQEVKFDAMNKGVASVALREQWMRVAADGKSVQQVMVLGWQARRSRLMGELTDMTERYAHDVRLLKRTGSDDSTRFLTDVTRNEEDKIAQLKGLLHDTDQKLTDWGVTAAQLAASTQPLGPTTTVVSMPDGAGRR